MVCANGEHVSAFVLGAFVMADDRPQSRHEFDAAWQEDAGNAEDSL